MNALIRSPRLSFYHLTLDDAPLMLALLNEPSFIENIGDRGVRTLAQAEHFSLNLPAKVMPVKLQQPFFILGKPC